MSETHTQEQPERIFEREKNKKNYALIVASSAIFASLSFLLSFLAPILPRVQWGLALFDPVSIVWILAFLIFGIETGLLTAGIGTFLLNLFDSFAPIGPLMKLTATLPLILIPWLIGKIGKREGNRGGIFKIKNILVDWTIATTIRIIIMVIFNYLVISIMFGMGFVNSITLEFLGMPNVTAWNAVIATVVLLNLLQSIWDYFIPMLLMKVPSIENKLPDL